jgi:DNA-binding MarR family transcriptional regulator
MEKDGLISREPNPGDARSIICLQSAGDRTWPAGW